MKIHGDDAINALKSLNYADSAVFGISMDIFKVRVLISVRESGKVFGSDMNDIDLIAEFRILSKFSTSIEKSWFYPPFIEDGDLAVVDMLDFNNSNPNIKECGFTTETQAGGVYGERRMSYEICFSFRGGHLKFNFVDLELSTFEALDYA